MKQTNIRKYGLWAALAAVCAAVLIFVAVQYRAERDQAREVVEEGYQQRLYEAQEHLQAIDLKLTKAGVASEPGTLAELFSGVSRQAESVLAGLSALPLSHQAMSDTLKFCNQLAEYAAQLCIQMAQGEALTEEQLTLLETLRGQCSQLTSQIALAQNAMVQESLRMAVSGSVFYEEASKEERPLEGVAEPDNGMGVSHHDLRRRVFRRAPLRRAQGAGHGGHRRGESYRAGEKLRGRSAGEKAPFPGRKPAERWPATAWY